MRGPRPLPRGASRTTLSGTSTVKATWVTEHLVRLVAFTARTDRDQRDAAIRRECERLRGASSRPPPRPRALRGGVGRNTVEWFRNATE